MSFSKILKRTLSCILCAAMSVTLLAGCGEKEPGSTMYKKGSKAVDYDVCLDSRSGYSDMVNYTKPEKGEEIVILTIKDRGSVKIKLFPELLPMACANFVGLATSGYYENLSFHRVISDFMIQGGDPFGNGRGGESVWGLNFDGGTSEYLYHVKGALAYANSGSTMTDGSQFYIVVGQKFPEDVLDKYAKRPLTETARKAYINDGGAPWLDGDYTVFGQVFEGMDLIEDICNNTVVDSSDKPVDDVLIEKVEVITYEG